ncbi:hypothetical protein T08_14534 [Trichinella sp. T8]|nr:hypothetical protein T08_14534 [Trichinella sp. T8]
MFEPDIRLARYDRLINAVVAQNQICDHLKTFYQKAHIVLLSKEANNSPNYLAMLAKLKLFTNTQIRPQSKL